MAAIVISALTISIIFYIGLGLVYKRDIHSLGDIIPIIKGGVAKVKGNNEFSASTVATSISLATVILAFFDLIPSSGLWLFWAVITTSLGFLFFSFLSKRIWQKLSVYTHRPSLHEFIGTEFNSRRVGVIAALFTSIGYLCMFAVELTVGAQFLAGFIPSIPHWIIIVVISAVGFIYTSLGGFRIVVVSDRIGMWFIWLLLFTLILFFAIYANSMGGISFIEKSLPEQVRTISWSNGLIPFILGLLVMNLFTYCSNMALWQRIAGSNQPEIVIKGIRKSVYQSAISWGLFVVIALGGYLVATPVKGTNFLITVMNSIYHLPGGHIVLFIVSLGLYAAMLSTSSTQLIAVSHTIYEDIIAPFRTTSLTDRIKSKSELKYSRLILIFSAIGAVGVVELLKLGGFSIADLAFSIYGAALSLTPPILLSLFSKREGLKNLGFWVNMAVISGFVSAWAAAILGNYVEATKNENLVFLSPVFGLFVSAFILMIGKAFNSVTKQPLPKSAPMG